ncbi:ABC transporter ATP-binding protein [Candidatus Woesearchaeota archaeon]|nr:ABC transporter ATP-binding protein [Candidatus Woesearchaeota archaeon]
MVSKKEVEASDSSIDQPVIMLKNVSKLFRKKIVLRDVTFDIGSKDIFGIIGMSGSGKTTLFQMMSGIIKLQAGDILVKSDVLFNDVKDIPDYVSVFKNTKNIRQKFGFASQIPSFYENLTVEENLMFYAALYNLPKKKAKESMYRLLRLVDLVDDSKTLASELSGGMQRRLDIACSMIHEPKILFLDEPTSDLDPIMRKQIWSMIKEINTKGTTVIISSHILQEIESLCTKVAILHNKKCMGYGTLKELKALFKRNRQVKVELESGNYSNILKKLKNKTGIEKVSVINNKMAVFIEYGDEPALKSIIQMIEKSKDKIVTLEVSDATLTDIFEKLTGE